MADTHIERGPWSFRGAVTSTGTTTLSGTTAITGTTTIGAGATLTSPTLTSPILTTPTITGPVVTYPFTTISGDGAVAVTSGITLLTKGSAAAITIAAPGAAGIGNVVTITTGTDYAHVVTFTGATLWDGTATANSTWTAAVVQGSSLTVVGVTATKWNVVSFNLGAIAP